MSRWGTWAPVVSAVAVAGLVVGVSLTLSGGGADGPPQLRLASGAFGTTDSAASAPETRGSGYRLSGTLPTGPSTAEVRELPAGAAPVNRVRELAQALGIDEAPERVVKAWRAGKLVVRDEPGHPWSFGENAGCGPDSAVSSDGSVTCVAPDPGSGSGSGSVGSGSSGSVGSSTTSPAVAPSLAPAQPAVGPATCPVPPPGAEPAPCDTPRAFEPCGPSPCSPPSSGIGTCAGAVGKGSCLPLPGKPPVPAVPAMSVAEAIEATQRLRTALGLGDAKVQAFVHPYGASVMADPRVGGLRTLGIATSLEIDAAKKLVTAHGWLADSRAGSAYPLLSAKAAFERLSAPMALGAPAMDMPCDVTKGCAEPAPVEVDGAELGLQLTGLQDSEAALVPTWLFSIAGGDGVLAQLAVEDSYISDDRPDDSVGVTPDPGTSDPGQTEPGQTEPARAPLAFDGAVLVDGKLSVRYGDACAGEGVTAQVKEGGDSVAVLLEQDAPAGDRVCVDLYAPTFVPVKLAAPLGDRTVVDGSSGKQVTVTTCPSKTEMCPAG